MALDKKEELENSLKEILLIAISDPEAPKVGRFHSFYNLLTFYSKNEPKKGASLRQFFEESEKEIELSEGLKGDLMMLFALCYDLSGMKDQAEVIYEDYAFKDIGMFSKSMLLNNYGVFLLEKMKRGGLVFVKENSSKVEDILQDAILESERVLLSTTLEGEGGQLSPENLEKIKKYLFKPDDIFNVSDMSLAQKKLNKSKETGFLSNIDTLVPLQNLAEFYLFTNNEKMYSLTLLIFRLFQMQKLVFELSETKGTFLHSIRIFNQICEYYLIMKKPQVALDVIGEAIYFLKNYKINNYLKLRTLTNYATALKETGRYFEASEIYQQYYDIIVKPEEINME